MARGSRRAPRSLCGLRPDLSQILTTGRMSARWACRCLCGKAGTADRPLDGDGRRPDPASAPAPIHDDPHHQRRPVLTRGRGMAIDSGATAETVAALGLAFPPAAFSLSHVALPFPVTDALYCSQPRPGERFGINLGTLTPRGERGVLVVPLDALVRISSTGPPGERLRHRTIKREQIRPCKERSWLGHWQHDARQSGSV
jgi:hypothetical protein